VPGRDGSPDAAVAPTRAHVLGLFLGRRVVAALLLPITVGILGIAFAAGWLPKEALSTSASFDLVNHPLAKVYLLALVSLPPVPLGPSVRYTVHHQFGVTA